MSLHLLIGAVGALALLAAGLGLALHSTRGALRGEREAAEQAREDAAAEAREALQRAEGERRRRSRDEEERREEDERRRLEARQRRKDEMDARECALAERAATLDRRGVELDRREAEQQASRDSIEQQRDEIRRLADQARQRLEELAGCDREEARRRLEEEVLVEARRETARRLTRLEDDAREQAAATAREHVLRALEATPGRVGAENTVTLVELPSDEMKGRIIGREGRNIRSIEMATGVDLIVDETPSAILLSSFDPARRELARRALLALVEDGRIHPARIEELVTRARGELEDVWATEGEAAAFELELADVHPKLIRLVGRLRHRSVEGQALLDHSVETAHLAGRLAGQIGLDRVASRRAGLLHEVARGLDPPLPEILPEASADLAAKYGEPPEVAGAVRSLAAESRSAPPLGVVLATAKRLSVSRPGARRHNLQLYLDRLADIERIARTFPGVQEVAAVKAGRELLVLLRDDRTDDDQAKLLARSIARQIQEEVVFPGQVKVSVIRETRAIEYAL